MMLKYTIRDAFEFMDVVWYNYEESKDIGVLMKAHWAIFLLLALFSGCLRDGKETASLTSVSPDGKYSISIVELDVFLDRNFEIRITDIALGTTRTVFRSPDEGLPVGTERIVWSLDGERFLLVGRKFYVKEGTADINGEDLYLMFDINTNRLWCNARQQNKYPAFAISDVLKKKWPEEIRDYGGEGVEATIKSLGGLTLSDKPLRFEWTLKNTSLKPVVLYDLANCASPSFQSEGGCFAGGPSSEKPAITLAPGESISRWVQLKRGQPSDDWSCRIDVKLEGTGVGHCWVTKGIPESVSFRVQFEEKVFSGVRKHSIEYVTATPWLEIQLENK